jgi:polysaccharide deacetylase 2 family uncharacterized protein YibQ
MAEILERIEDHFSTRAFLLGLCVVLGLYLVVLGILAAIEQKTLQELDARLANQSVVIDHIQTGQPEIAPTPVAGLPAKPKEVAEAVSSTSVADDIAALTHANPSENPSSLALPEAPIDGVYEETAEGILPAALPTGSTPFKEYRKPFVLNRDKPAIAIVVLDYGLSAPLTETLLKELPASVSFVLTPYALDPEHWQKKARANGHELWMQLMVQTKAFPNEDPGAKGLMTNVSIKYNQDRYIWTLARTTGYAGVAAFTDHALDNAGPMFQNIAQNIFQRGLGYLELSPERYSFFEPYAVEADAPAAHSNFALTEINPESQQVADITKMIADIGGAVVTIKPTPKNIDALKAWIASLETQGVQIVPVSAIAGLNTDG